MCAGTTCGLCACVYACSSAPVCPHLGPHLSLQAMQEASDGRFMDAQRAVAWLRKQLDAAEALWTRASGSSQAPDAVAPTAHGDYCLVMTCEEDDNFFMTEFAQEWVAGRSGKGALRSHPAVATLPLAHACMHA